MSELLIQSCKVKPLNSTAARTQRKRILHINISCNLTTQKHYPPLKKSLLISSLCIQHFFAVNVLSNLHIPVVNHQLLHSQQSVVPNLLVFVMHVVHYQLFTTKLFDHSETEERSRGFAITSAILSNHKILQWVGRDLKDQVIPAPTDRETFH